jgi:hypothetical protein
MTDILFGHGRTRKPSQAHMGRLQTLPQNEQLEWKGGESPSAIGLVKKAPSHSSISRLLRTSSGGSLASKHSSKNDSVESRRFFVNAMRSGEGEALTRTSSIDTSQHSNANGAKARRFQGDPIRTRSLDAQGITPASSRENMPSTDFATLSKQQQGTRLRQVIGLPPHRIQSV